MTSTQHKLRIASFNCKGWNNNRMVINDLLKSHDICPIQEHWLFSDHLKLLNVDPEFMAVGVSGMYCYEGDLMVDVVFFFVNP